MQTARGLREINAQLMPQMRDLVLKTSRSLQAYSVDAALRDIETENSMSKIDDFMAQYEYSFLNLLYNHAIMIENELISTLKAMEKGEGVDPNLIPRFNSALEKIRETFKNISKGKKYSIQRNKTIALKAIGLQNDTNRRLRTSSSLFKKVKKKIDIEAEKLKETMKASKVS